jgi:pantothenate kinase
MRPIARRDPTVAVADPAWRLLRGQLTRPEGENREFGADDFAIIRRMIFVFSSRRTRTLAEHLEQERQIAFLAGPRQVGKTTTARTSATLNHEDHEDRDQV